MLRYGLVYLVYAVLRLCWFFVGWFSWLFYDGCGLLVVLVVGLHTSGFGQVWCFAIGLICVGGLRICVTWIADLIAFGFAIWWLWIWFEVWWFW